LPIPQLMSSTVVLLTQRSRAMRQQSHSRRAPGTPSI
jgi:hypothetical protein